MTSTAAADATAGAALRLLGGLREGDRVAFVQRNGRVGIDVDFEMRRWFKDYAQAA